MVTQLALAQEGKCRVQEYTRRCSDNTRHYTLQQYTVGEWSSTAHAVRSHMSTVNDVRELTQGV